MAICLIVMQVLCVLMTGFMFVILCLLILVIVSHTLVVTFQILKILCTCPIKEFASICYNATRRPSFDHKPRNATPWIAPSNHYPLDWVAFAFVILLRIVKT